MTETGTSGKSKMYYDFDNYKYQEWLRRRKLRIEQVRKQSSHIAKMLRQKALNEEQVRAQEFKKIEEAKFRFLKAEKLDEMERKLRCALEEFGMGYKLAESEPEPNEIIQVKNTINTFRAQERGEIAMEEELKWKKLAEEEKNYPIERKKMTRKLENLRSALICSVSNRKDLVDLRKQKQKTTCSTNHQEEDTIRKKINPIKEKDCNQVKIQENADISKKVTVQKRPRKSQVSDNKSNFEVKKSCNNKNIIKETEVSSTQLINPVCSNLNVVEMPLSSRSSRMTSNLTKSPRLKKDNSSCTIEFYDHPSRYCRKSVRNYSDLVEKISEEFQCDAVEVAEKEELNRNSEVEKKNELDVVSQERGNRALRRERINRDCNLMMEKLGELQKKEKILKAQQHMSSDFIYMSSERLSEKMKTRQRIMESKFENIYHEAAFGIISQEPYFEDAGNRIAITDDIGSRIATADDTHLEEEPKEVKLSFSPGNLKTTSPLTSVDVPIESPVKTSPSVRIRPSKKKSKKKKRKLLLEIDRTLEEGRKLRERIIENRENFQPSLGGSSDVEEKESECLNDLETVEPTPREDVVQKSVKSQESQTEELKTEEVVVEKKVELQPIYINVGDKTEDVSLPLSTSTSYKSPPSTVRSYRLRKFLDYLENLDEVEEDQNDSKIKRKMQRLLNDLLKENSHSEEESNLQRSCKHRNLNRNLEYYVLKLLNMSRECIANLSVSSLNVLSPSITDLGEEQDNENLSNGFSKLSNSDESSFENEKEQKQLNYNWTSSSEHNFGNLKQTLSADHRYPTMHPSLEVVHTLQQCNMLRKGEMSEPEGRKKFSNKVEEKVAEGFSSSSESKYEKITQKCSARISELSNLLEKVRKDKEKLLNSTSGGSSLNFKNERSDDADLLVREEKMLKMGPSFGNVGDGDHLKNFTFLESFIDRYNLSRKNRGSTVEKEDLPSFRNREESITSLESFPHVMDELLEKEIITSPFKWSDGGASPESTPIDEIGWKPSSIESVVNNFRKEMSRVKSLSLVSSDPVPRLSSSIDEATDDVRDLQTSELISLGRKEIRDSNRYLFHEESSVESINHALTRLGLNWAKSILKKNEESRAMSSSSSSESDSNERDSPS